MITFTPHDDNITGNNNSDDTNPDDNGGDEDNLRIWVVANAGVSRAITATTSYFDLIDNDQQSRTITLSYGGAKIAQDADPKVVTVTATLDGAPLTKDLGITLLFDNDAPATGRATRDEDYKADGGVSLEIEKGVATGTADVTITPLNVGDGKIQVTTKDVLPADTDPPGVQVYGIIKSPAAADGVDDCSDNSGVLDSCNETTRSIDYDEDGKFTTIAS